MKKYIFQLRSTVFKWNCVFWYIVHLARHSHITFEIQVSLCPRGGSRVWISFESNRPVARIIAFLGSAGPPKVDLLDQKVDFLNLTPLNPPTKTPFLAHFVAKSGPFGRFFLLAYLFVCLGRFPVLQPAVGETGDNCNSFWKFGCNCFLIVRRISEWPYFERVICLL